MSGNTEWFPKKQAGCLLGCVRTCAQPNIYSDSEAMGQIHQLPYKVAARPGQLLVAQGCAVTALFCLLFG